MSSQLVASAVRALLTKFLATGAHRLRRHGVDIRPVLVDDATERCDD